MKGYSEDIDSLLVFVSYPSQSVATSEVLRTG